MDNIINMVYEGEAYQVYFSDFSDTLEIDDPKERTYWSRSLSTYTKKRYGFPIKAGTGNKRYVLLPENFVDELLKKAFQHTNHVNHVVIRASIHFCKSINSK